ASPRSTVRSTPRRMLTGPAAAGTVSRRSRTSIRGAASRGVMASMAAAYRLGAAARKALMSLMLITSLSAWAEPVRILALGDSLTAGYGLAQSGGVVAVLERELRARGHDVRVIDAGVSGDTSAGGRARLDWALAEGAEAAIVAFGGNDGLRGL